MMKKEDFNEHEQTVITLTEKAFALLQKKLDVPLNELHWLILIRAVRDGFVSGLDVAYDCQSSEEHNQICFDLNKITNIGVFENATPFPNDLS